MKITSIYLYDHGQALGFSADIAIDEQWIIQLDEYGEFSIPEGDVRCWSDRDAQDAACTEHNGHARQIARNLSIPKTAAGLRAIGAEDMLY